MKLRESDHPNGGDAEAGHATNGASLGHQHPPPHSFVSQRWGHLLLLSLAVVYMAYEVTTRSNVRLATVKGVRHNGNEDAYEPLIGRAGEIYHASMKNSSSFPESRDHAAALPAAREEGGSGDTTYPRIACFLAGDVDASNTCNLHTTYALPASTIDSMPQLLDRDKKAKGSGKGSDTTSDDVTDLHEGETDECKLADSSYQALPAAPSTCNDVHALGFRFGPSAHEPGAGVSTVYPSRHRIQYLTSGGFRSVWTVTLLDRRREGHDRVIMKTNMLKRGWSSYYLDQNRRDVLISERAGGAPERLFEGLAPITGHNGQGDGANSNVLPIYQYCAFSSVVPFATAGVLDDYVYDRRKEGNFMTAEEIYALAIMAARGLYQAQLYHDGKATHVHADVKPPQFLLFERPGAAAKNATAQGRFPVMQINDFNRGKFLTRSTETNDTCPFQMCHVHHKGSLYRSPEEYMDCADQADTIDVYSLGGVFYYLLSDGKKPWYYASSYKKGVARILDGEQPRLPDIEEYESYGERTVARIRERSTHPAFAALRVVMAKCWAFEPEDRPSSHEVVRMLEEKWREINVPAGKDKSTLWARWMDKPP